MDKLRRALNGNERCDEESGIITQVITFNKYVMLYIKNLLYYLFM